jgi:rRNA maturation RNase YbeY
MSFSLTNKTKGSPKILKGLPFVHMKEAILGKDYELSLVFVTSKEMARLNLAYRNKEGATDILSFPIDKDSGEIFISIKEAEAEAKKFERELQNFIQFLFIHGCAHLKGMTHGSRMESEERKFRSLFSI